KFLVDSPRFAAPLVKNIERLGGARRMLLTHQDDVADHQKFRDHFALERVLHRADVRSHTAAVEIQPQGNEPVRLDDDVLMIPTPGHTRGHAVYIDRESFSPGSRISAGSATWSTPSATASSASSFPPPSSLSARARCSASSAAPSSSSSAPPSPPRSPSSWRAPFSASASRGWPRKTRN